MTNRDVQRPVKAKPPGQIWEDRRVLLVRLPKPSQEFRVTGVSVSSLPACPQPGSACDVHPSSPISSLAAARPGCMRVLLPRLI